MEALLQDIVWLRDAGKGDTKAFESLYNKYWHQLYVAANKVLQDDLASEDIIQEVFTSLWNRAATLQVENLNAYLYQSVKFQVAKKLRESTRLQEYLRDMNTVMEAHHPYIVDKLQYAELLERVHLLVERLPDRCREIFIQSRFRHLSHAEIAESHNITVKTVENQINKALRYLRTHIDDYSFFLLLPVLSALPQSAALFL